MASSSGTATPSRQQSLASRGRDADTDLSNSLNGLSLRTGSPARTPRASSRGPFNGSSSRSPSVASNRGAPRSPLNGPNPRSGTPALLRKASLNSLRSSSNPAAPRRASSANLMSPSSRSPLGGDLCEEPPPPPPPTASSIARDHFKVELEAHHGENATTPANTVVIIQDNCYGHRFSRPRTSKAALSTIVERPERLRASVLGVSAAYVRLGERHADGAHPIHPKHDAAALPGVPFRIHKTARRLSLMSQTVTNVHGTKWMEELKLMCETAEAKLATNGKELQRPEMSRGSGNDTPERLHEGDLYLCSESLDALEGALGGICEAVDTVFRPDGPKRAFVAIRPPGHHCSASFPSGFCWVNNVHVGIMHAILGHGLTHAAIIDFDLHHGDGSQAIAWQHNSRGVYSAKNAAWWKKTSIGYFSLHDINSYPCEMGDEEKTKNASICIDNAHGQTIWNIHLDPYKTEAEFWKIYESKYTVLLEKTRKFLKQQTERSRAANQNCKAAIFISAGFDASEWESAGMQRHNVAVPTEFYAKITRDIIKIAEEEGTSVEGRVISALEGGYSDRALCSGVLSHISGLAGEEPMTKPEDFNGLGFEMGQRMGHNRRESLALKNMGPPYDPSWWHSSELERLECAMASPPAEPKVSRHMTPPTYSSPTQSSQAKVVASPKLRRSVSAMSSGTGSPVARPPSPPPPEVPWTIAAHELSKLLIPTDRSTMSCTHEDLSAEATRARRDRQSVLAQSTLQNPLAGSGPAAANGPTRMSMRERKQVKLYGSIEEEETKNRRKTVAGSAIAQERAASRTGTPVAASKAKQHSRRLSAASTIVARSPSLEPPLPSARPMTSQGVRADTSMNARAGATGSLPVKKTRTAAAVKRETPRTSRTTKKVPAPAERAKAQDAAQRPSTQASTASGPSQASSDDMDQLTSGMKKIRINVITPAQREAREKAKRDRAAGQEAEAAVAAAAVKNENQPPAVKVEAFQPAAVGEPARSSPDLPPFAMSSSPQFAAQPSASASSEPVTPQTASPPAAPQLEPLDVPLPASSPVPPLRTPTTGEEEGEQPSTPNVFIPYQPEGPTPEAVPLQQQGRSLQWLPPNTAATPSPMKRTDLPVFTATSAIPFASRTNLDGQRLPKPEGRLVGGGGGGGGGDPRRERSIWEVPETPQK
ncbi:uncharacterized protein E0L32_007320 [Thyridium curvatum]|uniref:Histone deacetylase domain-containing protein n=1 Tax=Thyridium curvatum TaxID=1093900 RepID=A0A507AX06_9PEZI|nr:uncharacterized protein E0L32_007320 [Thyridium curvatum]TPX12017.1 hypothetical protein E0L32_007320 [Thyridium curvatum]